LISSKNLIPKIGFRTPNSNPKQSLGLELGVLNPIFGIRFLDEINQARFLGHNPTCQIGSIKSTSNGE